MIRTSVRLVVRLAVAVVLAVAGLIVLLRFVDPPATPLMVVNAPWYGLTRRWVDLDHISPNLVRAVIASEDGHFFDHHGVDWIALGEAREYNDRHGGAPRRGGSTITMQCARNVFLWQGKSYARKALEIGLAYVLDAVWGKRRVLEIYLNVIEWGPGVYGAEAAAHTNFGASAATLGAHEAALLAAALPNPHRWRPGMPTRYLLGRAAVIERRAAHVRLDKIR